MSALPAVGPAEVTTAEFDRFREFFYRRTGIQFQPSKRYFVDKRILASILQAGAPDFRSWFAQLRLAGDDRLLQSVINSMTVNESYFFREDYQFDCLVNSVLPLLVAERRTAPIRILTLPSSTGDEAYSIAIWLLEHWPAIDQFDIEITGVDIDSQVVEFAKAGVFGERALQHVDSTLRARYFTVLGAGQYQVCAELRDAIAFTLANICEPLEMQRLRNFDVIFCRNLLIYFDELSSRRAAENLYGALRPGGYLFLGHSESMSRITPIFKPLRFPDSAAYQRPKERTR
ncbi:MAG: CheR family methyltransferase [Solirubrobacteraceae bacterium]